MKPMERQVYINSVCYPEKDTKISIFDSSVILGDTIAESTGTFKHKPFKLDRHIERFYMSLRLMCVNPEIEPQEMEEVIIEVLEKNLQFLPEDEEYRIVHRISRGAYHSPDEAFLTSTPYCIISVTRFNGKKIGKGKPGEITKILLQAWEKRSTCIQ